MYQLLKRFSTGTAFLLESGYFKILQGFLIGAFSINYVGVLSTIFL